ncbi:MAG: Rib/alpha-like domain-containing protein [Eubacteriales bacterium]|nr:Rib/alpha-like domain-containing protein [Eubacteriales bacterium]MDY3332411.1 Rib/alpha-like domain-containing protein [Gallibacter sp.]
MVFSNDWGARWHSPKAIYGTFNFKTKLVDVDRDGNLTNEVKQAREKGLEYITSLNSYSGILYGWKTNVMEGYILDTTLLEVANGNITDPNSLDDTAKVVAPKTVDFSIGVADVTKTYKQEIVEIKNEANQAMDNTKLPVKKGVYKIKVRTTYEDGTFDESINPLTITKDVPQSTLHNPKPMDIIVNVDETPEAESGISNKDELPGETTFIFKNGKPDTSKVAIYPVEIIVKYPDKTEAVVKTNLIVKGKPIKLIKLQKAQPIVKPKPESEVETVPSVPPVVDAVPKGLTS